MATDDLVTRAECMAKEKEHRDAISRVHERVDKVESTGASIETSAKIMSECVCRIEKVMFGDQNSDGIITKVSLINQKVSGAYWFGGVVIIALVGALVGLMFKK